ncbi:MAG: 2-oxo acid dehydrogenase subunit E2 [Candidatus Eremiobacteraeota bacterium]|nr:2-oxo acid dehydrogenase subunit E2 [Candidatus Eremiobacteraeota bacterium]
MATTITMPQLGETVTEGTVAQWLKNVGDNVEKYEAFVEVSTDKVNAEVPSPVTGIIREVLVKEGQTVATGTPIAVIDEAASASAPPPAAATPASTTPPAPQQAAHAPAVAAPERPPAPPSAASTPSSNGAQSALRAASPAVRRLAREHHVDIRNVRGTGANGRVTAGDVIAAARTQPVAAAPAAASTYANPIPGTTVPLTQARRIIAERMVESKHTAPHAWSMVEIDVTNVWKWRTREKDAFERETGYKLTLLPFFIRAVVESLSTYPLMNGRFTSDGIYVNKDVNIGIAIGLPNNLVVPVVKRADQLSIKGLAVAVGQLIDKARKGKLSVDDLAAGTFTVNNNGANGSWASAPIINAGQAGIVTMEAIVKKVVVRDDDSIAIRQMMNSCLSLDHRVVDGYVASGFLADLKKRLEKMGPEGSL